MHATQTLPAMSLRRFAQKLRGRHVAGRALGAALRASLATALPVLAAVWLVPAVTADVLLAWLATVALWAAQAAARAFWRSGRLLAALGRDELAALDGFAPVQDELLTWLELTGRGRAGDDGMLGWLERDVTARLQPFARRALSTAARPRLGRWRWLLPLVVLLLLLWLLSLWLQPPWPGVFGGRPDQPSAGGGGPGGGRPGDGAPPDPVAALPLPVVPQPVPQPVPRPEQLPEPEPEKPANEPPEPEPPAPLLDLPEQRRFVVPEFIGDGPTRRARVRAAEIEREGGAGRDAPAAEQRGGDQPSPAVPEPAAETFERAAEAALQSRHVPPAERPMVRRFFERLREAGG